VLLFCFGSNAAYAQWGYPRQWNVYPQWTRGAIQAVIDNARDGDVIYFNRGTYDFSAAPSQYSFQKGGALQIIDKSLTVKGAPGSIIVGAPVVVEPDTGWMKGILCFWILNPDANKSVTFDGLTFQTFMIGIMALHSNDDPANPVYYSNLRNLVVRNCTFRDIKRNGIACAGVQGSIAITNNKINGDRASSRIGIYADWFFEPGNMEWQPNNALITITNNSIAGFNYAGILTNRSSNMQITGNAISDSGGGIFFNAGLKNEAKVSYNALSGIDTEGILVNGYTRLINEVIFQDVARGLRLTNNNLSNVWGTGIAIFGDVAHSNYIAFNKISMASGSAIYSEGHDEQYLNNLIRGGGFQAVILGSQASWTPGVLDWAAHHEYFLGNSVSGYAPQDPNNPGNIGWYYELTGWTHDNIVIGIRTEHATYVDNGTNNMLRFVYPYVSPTVATTLMSPVSPKAQQKPKKDAATI
jgi:hypothetical protein